MWYSLAHHRCVFLPRDEIASPKAFLCPHPPVRVHHDGTCTLTGNDFPHFTLTIPPLPGGSTGPVHSLVAHHQHFQLFHIVDQELSEARGQHVFCLLIAPIADVGHQNLPLEAPAHSVIDASGFTPVALHKCTEQLQNEITLNTAGLEAAYTSLHTLRAQLLQLGTILLGFPSPPTPKAPQ